MCRRPRQAVVARHLGELRRRHGAAVPPRILQQLAAAISAEAAKVGAMEDDTSVVTPFALAAAAENYNFAGGKLDDVAVVVGVVHADAHSLPTGAALQLQHNFTV